MNTTQYPPPIRLAELVEAVGVDGVKELAARLGALEIAAKANQVWRFVLDGAIIIGYSTSAVVAGRDELTMRRAAVLLSIGGGADDPAIRGQARALDLALTARTLAESRGGEDYLTRVQGLMAHCAGLEEAEYTAVVGLLSQHAPPAAAWLSLIFTVYQQGFVAGYDLSESSWQEPWEEEEPWLPDVPAENQAPVTLSA